VIEATAAAPDAPAEVPAKASRFWRIVLFVVAVQLAVITVGLALFGTLGLADGGGGCGGL
jgi:hypothetical protein